ncbi:hypothetical protein PFTANZ_00814 [Plasmodium falciparum Tanzania (2000708)]|uniref:Uncharacterized protein n=1 Tax=Plasmodium falciparum Tanzania (2000708) TaxID=1036725 RepID=A0A024WE30_PLAFA|nr:hypothetical protein PFTANZ_00814 [Plasmodium falciparum Tanzania (2000708)]
MFFKCTYYTYYLNKTKYIEFYLSKSAYYILGFACHGQNKNNIHSDMSGKKKINNIHT